MAETLYFDNNKELINSTGNPREPPKNAVYRLDILNRHDVDDARWKVAAKSIRASNGPLCKGGINRGFFQLDALDHTDIMFRLYFIGGQSEPKPFPGGTLAGFVMVNLKHNGSTYYIDAICADLKRGEIDQQKRLGSLLVKQVEAYATRNGGEAVQLSALAYVIGYYRKLGYRHFLECPRDGRVTAPEDPAITEAAEAALRLQFSSDAELDLALRAELAKKKSVWKPGSGLRRTSKRIDQLRLVESLYDYFDHYTKFGTVNDEVVAIGGNDIEKITGLVRKDNSAILNLLTLLREKNFAVNCGDGVAKTDLSTKDTDGNYNFHCNDEGFTMMKCLDKPNRLSDTRPSKRMRVGPGGSKKNVGKIYKMARKTRKAVPWKGWGKISPKGRQRTVMKRICGKKCFLGPGKSFPVCAKGTCKVNKKGLYAAYIRSRQWGSRRSHYKGKGHPTHARRVYKNVARKSRRMLRRRGVRVGESTRRRRR
jgi:hypothetical protein